MSTTDDGRYLITGYVPKLALTGVGLGVFVVLSIAFWFNFFRYGRMRYMLVLCISSTLMALGFAIRIPMTNDPYSLGIYIVQYMLILLSPCGFLANSYVILPRLATWLDAEDCLFLKSRIIVRLFVWSDVITFLLQASGGGMTAVQGTMADIGHWIALIGLIIAALSFFTFTLLTITFGLRLRSRYPERWTATVSGRRGSGGYVDVKLGWTQDWRVLYWALLWSGTGIITRCVFRIAEFAQGYDGELRTVEVWFYVLDTLPLVIGIAVWAIVWPPRYLNEPRSFTPHTSTAQTTYEMGRVEAGSPTDSKLGLMNGRSPRRH